MQFGEQHLLKSGNPNSSNNTRKKGSKKTQFVGALQSGLNRRAFLRQSSVAVLFATIAACKPSIDNTSSHPAPSSTSKLENNQLNELFQLNSHQKNTIQSIQIKLFPDDGDGPSANDINALEYLQWTLTDPDNSADGDGEFVVQGVGWLDSLAEQTQGDQFVNLTSEQQDKVLTQISQSSAGENWLSILIYYLMEALLFDPIYGGNTNQVGWNWLNHQPGFPRPNEQTKYRQFI